ncbi:hypothetical protein N7465_009015 [Penicillium sp. CMV-2018d]|nr:hypothetical protein N7465_009015 [Penicillium sp. CMV-2018d]
MDHATLVYSRQGLEGRDWERGRVYKMHHVDITINQCTQLSRENHSALNIPVARKPGTGSNRRASGSPDVN